MNYEYIIKALIQAQDYINKANDSELPEEMREQLDKICDDIDWIRYDIEDMEKEGK
jgi:hypothetical protein